MVANALAFDIKETTTRLSDSLRTIEWAVSLVPEQWTHRLPEHYPADAWSVAMNIAHLVTYEEGLAAPMLEALAAGCDGTDVVASADERLADAVAIADQPLDALMARLRSARGRQIEVVKDFPAERFSAPLTPLWGRHYPLYGDHLHSAGWVASKTFQHTWEHGNAILRVALYAPR
ncbi:MAG: DinB family protein [Dehalococcoidia bacterium]